MKRFYYSYGGKTVWKTSAEVTAAASKDIHHADNINRRFAVAAMHELHRQAGDNANVHEEVPQLVDVLDDEDPGVRYWAMATIASLGANAVADSCEVIANKLKDTDPGVRTYACIALGVVGHECDAAFDYIPNLQEAIEDSDPRVRIEATKALTEMIEAEDLDEIAETLLTSLRERRYPIFRASSAEALGELGEAGLVHLADIIKVLDDDYAIVREAAAKALGNLGLEAMKDACVKLVSLAQSDPAATVKVAAAKSLKQMDLGQALEHEDASFRAWAAERAAASGPKVSTPLLEKLGKLLRDEDAKARYWSACALGDVGEAALENLETLLELAVSDPDPQPRVAATKACVKLDQGKTKEIRKDISPFLKHEEVAFRISAAECLKALGADALTEAPAVNEALLDEDPGVRMAAVYAILNMGKQAVRACGANLGECSRTDADHDVKKWSAFVLHEFGLGPRYGAPERKGV